MSQQSPSEEDLRRELEQVRVASPRVEQPPQPSVGRLVAKGAIRPLVLWGILILMFLAIRQFLERP